MRTSAATVLSALRARSEPFFSTRDAAAVMGLSASATSRHLTGLASSGLIRHVRHGYWALDPTANALAYAGWVCAPLPSYVSLYSALYQHGIIEQIPRVIYVVSLGKTNLLETDLGHYSIHQVSPEVFGGYVEHNGIRLATPEKAVFDTLYLARARGGRFSGLTEIEIPRGFDRRRLRAFAARISDSATRHRVEDTIALFLRDIEA